MTLSHAIAAIDSGIDRYTAAGEVVGCMVILAQDGRVVFSRAAGFADREAGRAMTPRTWLRYASVSKPFTTVAALRLMAGRRLSPEDPVTRYLPDFAPALPNGSRPPITVGQLMAHMAGLDYGFAQPAGGSYHLAGISDGIGESGITLAENLRRIASVPLDLRPGESWRYSIATDVLGAVIEAAADRPLPQAMRDLVTEPLGIEAAFTADPAHLAANYADGAPPRRMEGPTQVPVPRQEGLHWRFLPQRSSDPAAYPSGGGGMSGTVPAALTLLETLRDGAFIPEDLRLAARANRLTGPHPSRGAGWGHSWAGAVLDDPAQARIGLPPGAVSWGGIYGHSWLVDPARGLTLVAMTNTTPQGVNGAFSLEMTAALMD
ncbi:MAG: serine hydrolase domain-containing protein [Paracoccus sp. (in: a-proteobacteria)]|uniref:serine hydrolase domain-containing protein n=1 Tax=Paracoccus sp. TaxID=267 RepID=UPI0039E2AC49